MITFIILIIYTLKVFYNPDSYLKFILYIKAMPTVGNVSIWKLSPFVRCQKNIINDAEQEFQKKNSAGKYFILIAKFVKRNNCSHMYKRSWSPCLNGYKLTRNESLDASLQHEKGRVVVSRNNVTTKALPN